MASDPKAQRNREALDPQQREAAYREPFDRNRGGLREVEPDQETLTQEQLDREAALKREEAALKREREGLHPASFNREARDPGNREGVNHEVDHAGNPALINREVDPPIKREPKP